MELLLVKKDIHYKMPDGTTKTIPSLIPAFTHQYAAMKKLPFDRVIDCKTKVSRNANLNKKFWSITNYVFDNLPEDYEFHSINAFVDYIKLTVNYTEVYKVAGQVRVYPRSISFSKSEESTFQSEFYTPAIVLYSQIIGVSVDDLETASLEYTGIDYRNSRHK